jgi:uracil phosphoribosyltransferase
MFFNLSDHNSVASQFICELRDRSVQKDRSRFRMNIERIGRIMAYEISKTMLYKNIEVETPLETASASVLQVQPVLIPIMRAGLPFFEGFLSIFDHADAGFIGACREEGGSITIKLNYYAIPSIKDRHVILIDPMLATGKSLVRTMQLLSGDDIPAKIDIAAVIAAPEGIEHVTNFAKSLSCPVNIWTGAMDKRLNEKFYIVPGLGDAGDLCFGVK